MKKRTERCVKCGLWWNISRYARLPKGGYVCPVCRNKKAPGTAIPKGTKYRNKYIITNN